MIIRDNGTCSSPFSDDLKFNEWISELCKIIGC